MIGQKLGPYNIIEEIGKGGMATVFRAHQPSIDRDVAVKLIRTRIADDPTAIQRFQREARLIARLEHPHILPVYDFDGSHDPPYIVMRYLEGGTLKEVMAQGKLPLPEVTYLLRQVCSAMDYAHRQGIVHRDLKPSNILIDREGNAFVMDFGIARMAADMGGKQITETGAIVGTPDYMAPEQIQGSNMVDQRADVYSLGIIAYEMLSNDFPFPKVDAMAMMYHHMKEEPASICEKAPDLPDAVEDVMDLVLEKDPELRYSSAAEFAEELTKALGGTVSSSPVTLRAAAGTSIIKRVGGFKDSATDSRSTPSEQNKTVTALYANAAEYNLLVGEIAGGEAARRAMEALWKAYERVVGEQEGQIFARTDTELLVLWGADATHEDDAERAVRTAVYMQETIQELGAPFLADDDEPLPLNIGVNSGMALLIPQGETGSLSASGTTISIANRLMQNAYGTILITHDTFRQVMGVFDIQEDVPLRVRGRKEPLETYQVIAEKARSFRRQLRGIEGIETQMVGRRAEMEQLQKAYLYAVEDEETQVVTIISEPGLGKSRLLYEFSKWGDLREEFYRIFRGRATSAMHDRPYALIRDMMSFRFDILDSDTSTVVREKLEAGVSEILQRGDSEMAHMIGQLCGFDMSESRHIKGLLGDPQQLTNRAKQLFIRFFTTLAGEIQPVVIELEDIHHADDASLDLLNELFMADDELQLLVINNARPALFERRPEWGSGQDFHTQIELKALDKRDSRDLARELLQKVESVPKSLRDLLVERAEGNPFYMEELVKTLLDDRVILRESEDVWQVEESRLGALNVPNTLNGLLEARLDTLLAPEKLTLQRASVIGRIFYDSALEAIDAADENHIRDLEQILENLAEREFIHRRETTNFEGSTEYIFASNMLRDAIENALLERQIHTFNKAAAEWLVDIAGNRVDEYLPQIAEYYEIAGEGEEAAHYLLQAFQKALNISAYTDGQDVLKRAIKLVSEDSLERAQIELNMSQIMSRLGNLPAAGKHAQSALKIARQLDDNRLQAYALNELGQIATTKGEWNEAISYLDEALPIARTANDPAILGRVLYGQADTYFRMNDIERAIPIIEETLEIAREIGDIFLELIALNRYGSLYSVSLEPEIVNKAISYLEECVALAQRVGNREWEAGATVNLGVAAVQLAIITGDSRHVEDATRYAESAAKINREIGNTISLIISLGNLSEGYMELGDFDKAYPTLIEAIQVGKQFGAVYWQLAHVSAIARLRIYEGKIDEGLEILGAYHYHPVSVDSGQEQTPQILPLLEGKLSDKEIEEKMFKGKDKDFMAILDAFLEEHG